MARGLLVGRAMRPHLDGEPLDGPPARDDELPLGVVTDDEELVRRVGVLAARAGVRLVVASAPESAAQVLRSRRFAARLIDTAAALIPPALRVGWALVDGERHVIAIARDAQRDDDGPLRFAAYPFRAIEQLLADLGAVLELAAPRHDGTAAILGRSPAIRLVRDQVRSVARFRDVPVMVLGETGTGKELVAEAIHRSSSVGVASFVGVNCAAIPEPLFESELFGHEAGAFTGARGVRVGLLEAAAGGTLFLDEIGEMPEALQSKLLRALESREFRRVGATRDVPLTARVVSATNRAVWTEDGALRADLRYRLAGFVVLLPPLRDRAEDVPLLAKRFLGAFTERHRMPPMVFSEAAMSALAAHSWPGNVRELRAAVEHAAIVATTSVIAVADLAAAVTARAARATSRPPALGPHSPLEAPSLSPGTGLRDLERELILRTFEAEGRNVSRAAQRLGIPRSTLRDKLARLRRA